MHLLIGSPRFRFFLWSVDVKLLYLCVMYFLPLLSPRPDRSSLLEKKTADSG